MAASDDRYDTTAEAFDFEAGDTVLVRVRENGGTNGPLVAKFIAECEGFRDELIGGAPKAVLSVPWGGAMSRSFNFAHYDAEFEPVADTEEVTF